MRFRVSEVRRTVLQNRNCPCNTPFLKLTMQQIVTLQVAGKTASCNMALDCLQSVFLPNQLAGVTPDAKSETREEGFRDKCVRE